MVTAGLLSDTDLDGFARYCKIEALSRKFGDDLKLTEMAYKLGSALGIAGAQSKLRVRALKGKSPTTTAPPEKGSLAEVVARLRSADGPPPPDSIDRKLAIWNKR